MSEKGYVENWLNEWTDVVIHRGHGGSLIWCSSYRNEIPDALVVSGSASTGIYDLLRMAESGGGKDFDPFQAATIARELRILANLLDPPLGSTK